MKEFLQRTHWWLMRRTNTVRAVGHLDVVILHADGPIEDKVISATREALDIIYEAGGENATIVKEYLKQLGAMQDLGRRGGPAPALRGAILNVTDRQFENPRLLACHLVWAATYNKQILEARHAGITSPAHEIEDKCHDAELILAKSFPDSPDWMEYLQHHKP